MARRPLPTGHDRIEGRPALRLTAQSWRTGQGPRRALTNQGCQFSPGPALPSRPTAPLTPSVGMGSRVSAGDDGGRQRDPVILGPRRAQGCPWPTEHVAGSRTEDPGRLRLDGLRVEEVNLPAALIGTLGEHLAVHDRVCPGRIRLAALDGDVVRKVERPGPQRHRDERSGQRGGKLIQRRRCRPQRRRPNLRDHARGSAIPKGLGFMFDRRRRHAGLDQLDPPAIHNLMAGLCGDSHGPAEMMGDPQAHTTSIPGSRPCPPVRPGVRGWP